MPTRLSRGLRILELLKQGVPVAPSRLSASMTVSRRTIFRDIANLKSLGYQIDFDPDAPGYFLTASETAKRPRNGTSASSADTGETCGTLYDPEEFIDLVMSLTEAIALRRTISIKVLVSSTGFSESSVVQPIELKFGVDGWLLKYRASKSDPLQCVGLEEAKFHFDPPSQSSQDD